MRPSATSLEQLRALVWDDVRLRERLYQPDDIRSFVALVVASGRDHGLELAAADIEAAMRAYGQAAPRDVGAARLPPTGWLPFRTQWQQGELHVEWIYFGGQPLRAPFFEETTGRVRSKPFNLLFCHATPIGALLWGVVADWLNIDATLGGAGVLLMFGIGAGLISILRHGAGASHSAVAEMAKAPGG